MKQPIPPKTEPSKPAAPSPGAPAAPATEALTAETRRARTQPAQPQPAAAEAKRPVEIGGPSGPEPTRYGDWERNGRVSDF